MNHSDDDMIESKHRGKLMSVDESNDVNESVASSQPSQSKYQQQNHPEYPGSNYELIPEHSSLNNVRNDHPIQYCSKPYGCYQQNKSSDQDQENYELTPRDNAIASLRTDSPVQFGSKPFVYQPHQNLMPKNQPLSHPQARNQRESERLIQRESERLIQRDQDELIDSHKETFIHYASSNNVTQRHQVSSEQDRGSNISNVNTIHHNMENEPKRQKQQSEECQPDQNIDSSKSIVSKSSQKSQNPSDTLSKEHHQHILSTQNVYPASNITQNIQTQFTSSHKVISIQASSQDQVQEILYKYHFQTQKDCYDVKNEHSTKPESIRKTENQYPEKSPNFMKVSLQTKNKQNFEGNRFFQAGQSVPKQPPSIDPYQKYKRSAQSSPIIIQNKKSSVSIEIDKHSDNYEAYQQQHNRSHLQPEHDTSEQKLVKSLQQIDKLRKDLLKSTQNNINAIFNTNLTSEECRLAQMVEGIQKKVGELCHKVEKIEENKVHQIQFQVQQMKMRQRERQKLYLQKERQLRQQRCQDRDKRNRNSNQGGNMIIDLGKSSANEGKIIAIYPNNKLVSVKDLMFAQPHQPPSPSPSSQHSLRMMLQMQQKFLTTLHQFQAQVNLSIDKKLQQVKTYQQTTLQSRKRADSFDKIERLSQETDDKEEEYDDSRGSINVIYIGKLRQLEEEIREKKERIERLERHNFYLEKQLEKWEQVNQNNRGIPLLESPQKSFNNFNNNSENQLINPLNFKKHINNSSSKSDHLLNPLSPNHQNPPPHFQFLSPSNLPSMFPSPPSPFPTSFTSPQPFQQRIKEPVTLTSQQLNSLTNPNKKKNTHSFHYHESKNIQITQLAEMRQKLAQYQLALKEKDQRIKQLENTIMDYLESSRKWKVEDDKDKSSSKSSIISGYQSVTSQQANNPELLRIKINNLKTLLKEAKRQTETYKKLYQEEKQKQKLTVKSVSQKTTIKKDTTNTRDSFADFSQNQTIVQDVWTYQGFLRQ